MHKPNRSGGAAMNSKHPHAIAIIRPLVIGQPISGFWLHFSYLCVFGAVGMYIAVAMVRRRLII